MKTFKNEKTEMSKDGFSDAKHDYKSLCLLCMGYVNPQIGMKADEMYKNFKIMDKLETVTEEIALEDAEHTLLLQKVASMPWVMQHKDIVTFADAVKNAK